MIDAIIEGLVGGYLGDRLLKLIPPKKKSQFDSMPWDQLRARNNWIDIGGTIITGLSLVTVFVLLLTFGLDHNAWRVGFGVGFPFFMPLLFVSAVTLRGGLTRFREYWRYHELKHRIRLAVLLSLYIPFVALGLVSAFKILT